MVMPGDNIEMEVELLHTPIADRGRSAIRYSRGWPDGRGRRGLVGQQLSQHNEAG